MQTPKPNRALDKYMSEMVNKAADKTNIKTFKQFNSMKAIYAFTILAIGAGAFACSDDKDYDGPQPGTAGRNAIEFTASAPRAPRDVSTTENLEKFYVTAYTDGTLFMENVEVSRQGSGAWGYTPRMYWPAEGTVNFFSYTPDITANVHQTENGADIPGYVNPGNIDLLYGVNMDESSPAGTVDKQVKVNFRHALSQVRFKLRRQDGTHNPLRVEVGAVQVMNICSTGTFNFPRATTSADSDVRGEWSDTKTTVSPDIYRGENITLTSEAQLVGNSGYIFTVPQILATSVENGYEGAYVRVLCSIYDETSGVKLWPSTSASTYDQASGSGYLYFPLASTPSTWDAGKAYVYSLTIGMPQGSSAIEFDVTVDDYQDFADIEL